MNSQENIGGFSFDTEVLTTNGWKNWTSVVGDEEFMSINLSNGAGEWVRGKGLVKNFHQGSVEHFHHLNADFITHINHSHVVKFAKRYNKNGTLKAGRPKDSWLLEEGSSLPRRSYSFLATIPAWQGDESEEITVAGRVFKPSSFAKFMGMYLSEGNISFRESGSPQIAVSQMKHQRVFLESLKEAFPEVRQGKAVAYITLSKDMEFAKWLQKLGYSWEKYIPEEIKSMSIANLNLFLDYYILGDGNTKINKMLPKQKTQTVSKTIATSSKRMVDDLCEIILKTGKRPSVKDKPEPLWQEHKNGRYLQKHTCYIVAIGNNTSYRAASLQRLPVDYSDFVYNVELERHHTLIIRRNGKIIVSGSHQLKGE